MLTVWHRNIPAAASNKDRTIQLTGLMCSCAVCGCEPHASSTMCNPIQDITWIQLRDILILYSISLKVLAWSVFPILRTKYWHCHILESVDCVPSLYLSTELNLSVFCKHAAKTFPFLIIYDGKGHETDEKPYSINTGLIFSPYWFWKVFPWLVTLWDTQRENS